MIIIPYVLLVAQKDDFVTLNVKFFCHPRNRLAIIGLLFNA